MPKPLCWIYTSLTIFLACGQTLKEEQAKILQEEKIIIATKCYDSISCPEFFKQIVLNHSQNFYLKDSHTYLEFCRSYHLPTKDSIVRRQYYTMLILHTLLTSSNASNGSRGKILNIPYFWHWVKPNPRHEIQLTTDNKKLSAIKPPFEFRKYNSFADIDRTPALFFKDMFEVVPKYFVNSTDTFSTFGWCSEREMAFVCLMDLLGYLGKVAINGNHSWSEFIVIFKTINGDSINLFVKVDNTFNHIHWHSASSQDITAFNKLEPGLKSWYNNKAHDSIEKQTIKNLKVPIPVSTQIENNLCQYLRD